jgi:hypothetical protein
MNCYDVSVVLVKLLLSILSEPHNFVAAEFSCVRAQVHCGRSLIFRTLVNTVE